MRYTTLFLTTGILIMASCGSNSEKKSKITTLETDDQKLSYSVGYDIGKTLKTQGFTIELEYMFKGLSDGWNDSIVPLLTDEEMKAQFQAFQQKRFEAQMKEMQQLAAPNIAAGQQYMTQQMQSNPNIQKTESGLLYEVIKKGNGKTPTLDNVVKVNYTGTLIDGTVFDSTKDKAPAVFPLNGVIKGWQEGLQLMPVGSTYRLIIPSELAYGNNPPPQSPIQPGSTLIFEVELLSIEQ